jgi:uncharacterized protein
MPGMYFDTSALVKRYVSEVGSHWVRITLARSSPNMVYASALAQPEVLSALQRKVREAQLTQVDAHRLASRVTNHFAWRYRLLAITPGVIAQACAFVAADATLLAAATAEGLEADNPLWHP